MNENEFDVFGKRYVAVVVSYDSECKGCAMDSAKLCASAPLCSPASRSDGRNVIFVEVQDERAQR